MRRVVVVCLLVLFSSGCANFKFIHAPKVIQGSYEIAALPPAKPEKLDYCLAIPNPIQPERQYPLVVVLHGTGEVGCDYAELLKQETQTLSAFILAPTRHHPFQNDPKDINLLNALILNIEQHYPIDPSRDVLIGVSSGALIAKRLLAGEPGRWRAAVLVVAPVTRGWMNEVHAPALPPILYVQSEHDDQSRWSDIQLEIVELKKMGVNITTFLDPKAAHGFQKSWQRDISDWLQHQLQ